MPMTKPKVDPNPMAGFVGYDEAGRFLHYCRCGNWATIGTDVSLKDGQLGQWSCTDCTPQQQREPAAEQHQHRRTGPPDLHDLIRKHGTYRDITPEAWAQYDAEVEQWKADLRADVRWEP